MTTASDTPPSSRQASDSRPLSGPDEQAVGRGAHGQGQAIRAAARVDDGQDDRVRRDVRQGLDEGQCAGTDIHRGDAVPDVDDGDARRDAVHDRVTDPDRLVADAKVGQEGDGADHVRTVARAPMAVEGKTHETPAASAGVSGSAAMDAGAGQASVAGAMFWFMWNRLVGS